MEQHSGETGLGWPGLNSEIEGISTGFEIDMVIGISRSARDFGKSPARDFGKSSLKTEGKEALLQT
jgi:hypothetical protein